MSKEEHELVIMMFARLAQYIEVLENILRREGLAGPGDLPAFELAATADVISAARQVSAVSFQYRQFASACGVHIPK